MFNLNPMKHVKHITAFFEAKRVSFGALDNFISSSAPKNLSGESGLKNEKGFTVYSGWKDEKLVYIGTTVQVPTERFRWHKYNGKDLKFVIEKQFDNESDMLDYEFEMIKKHKPQLNNITHRRQNLNRKLTPEQLESRKGDKNWCQSCLKRSVNPGYSTCYYCKKSK